MRISDTYFRMDLHLVVWDFVSMLWQWLK